MQGRHSIVMRGKVEIETLRGEREAIIVSEVPYQVNKAAMVERIGELWRDKKIDGIAALRDESDAGAIAVATRSKRAARPSAVPIKPNATTSRHSTSATNLSASEAAPPWVWNLGD